MTGTLQTPAEIAVIIVNYGTAELTIEAVESVLSRAHHGRTVEVHVVDNASPDGDADRLVEAHREGSWSTGVILHAEAINHGFGCGNNVVLKALAARETPPDKVLLLNPDAALENEAIAVLADFLDDHPEAAGAGAAISLPDGTQATAAFRFPSLAGELEKAVNFGPVSRALDRWKIALPADLPTGPVDWLAGAAVMFRFAALKEVGFFDPTYFLYFEEVDLMRALTNTGGQMWFVADARVVHFEGASTGVAPTNARRRRPAYVYQSWRHYFRKHHGRWYAIATAALVVPGAALNHVFSFLRRRKPWLPQYYIRDHTRLVLLPLILNKGDPSDA